MAPGSVQLAFLALAGMAAGLLLLARGFGAYRQAARIADTSTSRIATLAVGEVRVSGIVEAAELSLVSPLQSTPCVYYRSTIEQRGEEGDDTVFREERAVGFRVRDGSGTVRVFPRDARFDVPLDLDASSGALGDVPADIRLRSGSAYGMGERSREAQIAALLTVRPPEPILDEGGGTGAGLGFGGGFGGGGVSAGFGGLAMGSRTRRYREARLEPGDVVTIVGQALPFDQLPNPSGADLGGGAPAVLTGDPEIAADLAEARARGELAGSPEEAWGNAAIPGFGIGRPVRAPEIDPEAAAPPLASADEAARAERIFDIAPDALVLAAAADAPLLVAAGPPVEAAARHEREFVVGLLGAVLAVGSAVGLAVVLGGMLP